MGGGGSKDGGPASAPPADVRNALTTSFHSIRKKSSLAPVEGFQVITLNTILTPYSYVRT